MKNLREVLVTLIFLIFQYLYGWNYYINDTSQRFPLESVLISLFLIALLHCFCYCLFTHKTLWPTDRNDIHNLVFKSFKKYQYHTNSLSWLDPDVSVYCLVTINVIATPIKVNMVITNFLPIKIWPPKHYWMSYISMWITAGCYFMFFNG